MPKKWIGGECPVDADAVVLVEFRDGTTSEWLAAWNFDWQHNGDGADIVKYRQADQ